MISYNTIVLNVICIYNLSLLWITKKIMILLYIVFNELELNIHSSILYIKYLYLKIRE
jgi:hypothetical protein